MNKPDRRQAQISSAVSFALILLLVVVSSFICILASTSKSATKSVPQNTIGENPEEVRLCQLMGDPGKYNRKLVRVTGFLSHGFEDSAIFDPSCESRFGIWYEYGGKNSSGTMYCCGVTSARTRPKEITVENIPIPLLTDSNFQTMDRLLHKPPNAIVHVTVIGRFFSGEKGKAADGRDWWQGYGHMGCCSLLMIQQVLEIDSHDRTDVDYGASADQPDIEQLGCGSYQILRDLDSFPKLIALQKAADDGLNSWAFDDPLRVAVEVLAKQTGKEAASFRGLRLKRQTQGRMVYEWKQPFSKITYMVVVSRPYELSFYAKRDRVVWVPIAAYRACV